MGNNFNIRPAQPEEAGVCLAVFFIFFKNIAHDIR